MADFIRIANVKCTTRVQQAIRGGRPYGPGRPAAGKVSSRYLVAVSGVRSGRSEAGARIGKRVIPMSRQLIIDMLRRAGLEDAAASALKTLPDQVDQQDAERFCKENGLPSMGSLTDRMGGSP